MSIGINSAYGSYATSYMQTSRVDKVASKTEDTANTPVAKPQTNFEKTIPDSVLAGLDYIKGLEKQISGTKFFVGTVSYGQTYGNSSDINFVVNPKFLSKLGADKGVRNLFEQDVKYLNEFSKRFREQQLSQGREVISSGWFCDENGNWGGWSVSRPLKQTSVLQDMADNAEKILQEQVEERKKAELELKEHFGNRFIGFDVKWQEDTTSKDMVDEETEKVSEKESKTISGKIGVNVGKTARKIAAAKTKAQLQAVIAEISRDMQEVRAGLEKGWCDESEVAKVNSLMSMAQSRIGQVSDREATPEEQSAFNMVSLM